MHNEYIPMLTHPPQLSTKHFLTSGVATPTSGNCELPAASLRDLASFSADSFRFRCDILSLHVSKKFKQIPNLKQT